jgi:hypothetical protein
MCSALRQYRQAGSYMGTNEGSPEETRHVVAEARRDAALTPGELPVVNAGGDTVWDDSWLALSVTCDVQVHSSERGLP